jgi:hypothetical protein
MTNATAAWHTPMTLGDEPDPWVVDVADFAARGKVVLYTGAGVSVAAPSNGPRGNDVADALRQKIADLLGVEESELADLDLEGLAQRVAEEKKDSLGHLKVLAAEAADFISMSPNYAHEVLALLLREGVVTVITANWDCGIEEGGLKNKIAIRALSRRTDLEDLRQNELPLYKVHGCATRPPTLVLTRAEVDAPRDWAKTQVQSTLDRGHVVFLGLGTLGAYVSEPLTHLKQAWEDEDTRIHVVDLREPSDTWRRALGAQTDALSHTMSAERFADDLLRAVVRDGIERGRTAARNLDALERGTAWSHAMVSGMGMLRQALFRSQGDAVLLWWRGSVAKKLDGHTFVLDDRGREALLGVAQLVGRSGDDVVVEGSGGDLTVRAGGSYYEVACWPGLHISEVEVKLRSRVIARRNSGRYGPGRTIAAIVHGASGDFASQNARPDIAAFNGSDDADIAAGRVPNVMLYSAEDAMKGQLA